MRWSCVRNAIRRPGDTTILAFGASHDCFCLGPKVDLDYCCFRTSAGRVAF